MWGVEICDRFSTLRVGQVLAIKGARVSDYGGKSLNVADDHAQLYPDIEQPETAKLVQWYRQHAGSDFENVRGLTAKRENRDGDFGKVNEQKSQSNLNLIREINESVQEENDVDQNHFFFLNGYVSRMKNDERIYYPACQGENCSRKVIEDQGGYRCEHCNKSFATFKPTYMIMTKISDFTESIWVNFAREHGTALMGMTAEEFKDFKENNNEEVVQNHFDSLLFKSFNIMVKGKYESFNGENRMRYFAVKVYPHNVQAENKALLKRLEMYANM